MEEHCKYAQQSSWELVGHSAGQSCEACWKFIATRDLDQIAYFVIRYHFAMPSTRSATEQSKVSRGLLDGRMTHADGGPP